MGSNHAPEDGSEASPLYPYSFGYKQPGNMFRTVMAYNCPVNCPRILYFSNPLVSYSGQPTGTVAQHNNALSINNARSTIANWRQAVTANTAPTITALGNQAINEDGATSALAFTVGDAQTPATSLSVSATSSNTALVSNTSAGLALSGSGASRTLTVTPLANQSGTTTITVAVSDGALSASRSFELSVTPVNDAPTLSGVPLLVSTTTDVATSFTVTVTDIDSLSGSLALTGATTNAVLLQPAGILVTSQSSTATSRTFLVTLTPAPGQNGSGGLIVTGSDSSAPVSAPVAFNVTTVATHPDPPTATTANASGTSVTIGWTAALTGGAPSSFVVEIGTEPGTTTLPTQSAPSSAAQAVLSLPAGTYYARVRAVNAVGTSAPSPEASVTVVDPGPLPGPPGMFSARTSGTTIVFTWTAPTLGEPPTRYLLEAGSAPGLSNLAVLDTGGINSSFSVPQVPPGTYWVRVRAANAAGVGAPSQDVSIVMGPSGGCAGLPGVPVLLTPVASGNTVTLSWNAPTYGGLPAAYVLLAGSGPGLSNLAAVNIGSATSFAASAPAGLYFVRVAARNACGVGPASNEMSFTLGSELPGAPEDLSWSVSPGGLVALAWAPPASGGPPTSYLVEAGSSGGLANLAAIPTGSAATSLGATAPPGTYFGRVRAVNGAGPGSASTEVVVIVP
jgi:filamentous hemagglutinin family protein